MPGQRPHGLADGAGWQAGQAAQHLPLFGHGEPFETGVAVPRAALDIPLQALQQAGLSAAAEEEVGAAAQVFFELSARPVGRGLQRALALAGVPEQQDDEQGQGDQGFGEVLPEQGGEAVALGAVEQGDGGVLGEVPE
ncbi:hypothetical protein D9M68_629180 [compost metagenome]